MTSLLDQATQLDQKVGQFLNIANEEIALTRLEESSTELRGLVKRGIQSNKLAKALKIVPSSLIQLNVKARVEKINQLLVGRNFDKVSQDLKSLSQWLQGEIIRLHGLMSGQWARIREDARPIIGTLEAFASIDFRQAALLAQQLKSKTRPEFPSETSLIDELFRELSEADQWIREQTGESEAVTSFIEECLKDGSNYESLMKPEVAQWLREKGLLERIRVKLA